MARKSYTPQGFKAHPNPTAVTSRAPKRLANQNPTRHNDAQKKGVSPKK